MSGAMPAAVQGMPVPGAPGPGMDAAAFAAQMRAHAVAHAAARHDYHASAGHHKRCGVIAIVLHLSLAVLVTAITWATYYSLRGSRPAAAADWYTGYNSTRYTGYNSTWYTSYNSTMYAYDSTRYYPWPFFVNWVVTVTVLGSVGFTLATITPLISSCRVGPRWNTIVVGNLVVVNVMLWLIYAITCSENICYFPWPIPVTMGSICVAVVTTAIACVTGYASGPSPGPLVVTGRVVGDLEGGHAAK